MSTYLELVQDLHETCNVGGSTPTSANWNALTGIPARLKSWVRDADIEIKSKWFNWKFLWASGTKAISSNTAVYTGPTDLGIYDKETFMLDGEAIPVIEYRDYKETLRRTTASNDKPTVVVIQPDNTLRLWPTPDASYTLTFEYYKSAVASTLSAATDQSVIPAAFHRAIYYWAMLKYANYENAGELRQMAMENLYGLDGTREGGWIAKLEAHQLPGHGYQNATQDGNYEIEVMAE